MSNSFVRTIVTWLVTLLIPLALILTGVRLLLTPMFIQVEYHMPNFPEDRYGMTQTQRLELAPVALDYLLNDEEISFLGDLTFEDGSYMFNERELRHMVDVKVLTSAAINVWYVVLGLLFAAGIWAWQSDWRWDYRSAIARGGMLTMVLIGAMILFLVINFRQLFLSFHRIFFEGDSWLFLYSDTLIRLFPTRFWQDAFIFAGAFSFIGGILLWFFLRGASIQKTNHE
jgi:integral membrane protein (TIGR01906 family)